MRSVANGDIGNRIRVVCESMQPVPMRQSDLVKKLQPMGISQQRISGWWRGKHDPPPAVIAEIAKLTGTTIEFLTGQSTQQLDPGARGMRLERGGLRWIPVSGAITAGQPSASQSDPEWLEIKDWGSNFERWGRIIDGFSMEPDLLAGDVAIFENRRAEVGHVVHAFHSGDDTVKVWRRDGERMVLAPLNTDDYKPWDAEGWYVKGVLVMLIRSLEGGVKLTYEFPHGMRPKRVTS